MFNKSLNINYIILEISVLIKLIERGLLISSLALNIVFGVENLLKLDVFSLKYCLIKIKIDVFDKVLFRFALCVYLFEIYLFNIHIKMF